MTEEFLDLQIRRMGGLDGYPTFEPGGYAELVRIAGKFGRSEAHLRAIMDEVIDTWTKCPKPSELRAMLEAGKPPSPVKIDCPNCEGSGWRLTENAAGLTGATRCECGTAPRGDSNMVYDKREKPATLKEFM